MKSFAKTCLVVLAALTITALTTNAQTNTSDTSTNAAPPAAKPRPKPYVGTIASVDADAKTFVVTLSSGAMQTNHIGAKTRLRKSGAPATLADAAAGDKVRGSAHKNEAGEWEANTVLIGDLKLKADSPQKSMPQSQ